jgi:CheY-like chemotaxis protein
LGESPSETIKVLHVDDEENQLEFIKVFITEIDPNISIDSAQSPTEALNALDAKHYDCVVCDYQMPEMDGLSLSKRIRVKCSIPFIIYTGRGSEEVAEAAFAAEVDDYVQKEMNPTHYRILANSIRKIVERERANCIR